MAEVGAIHASTPSLITQKVKAVLLCLSVGFAASILNVYLQFILDECFRVDSPLFIRMFEDGFDDMFACVLYFTCGLTCFCAFLYFCRSSYAHLSLNMVAVLIVLTYGYSAHYWLFHWHLGFDHWSHIAMMQVPFIVASTIYPVCLAVMYVLTLLVAKVLQKYRKPETTESQVFLWREGMTLVVLLAVSMVIWFNFYGTVQPYFGPASPFQRYEAERSAFP